MVDTHAIEVVAEALREWHRKLGSRFKGTQLWDDQAEVPAAVAIGALLALPVDERMEAMGMRRALPPDLDEVIPPTFQPR